MVCTLYFEKYICQESSLIGGQLCTPEGAVFQFSYLYFFSIPMVVHYVIRLMISQLRICPQQRIVEGLNKLYPLAAFLA